MANGIPYLPRHLAPLPGRPDVSAWERRRVDGIRAGMAMVVLHKRREFPPARTLHLELRRARALFPTAQPSVHISLLGISA